MTHTLQSIMQKAANRLIPFRGSLKPIGNPSTMQQDAGLDWETRTATVQVEGTTVPGLKAIVRGDTGAVLSVASDAFKGHQNSDILRNIREIAEAGDAELMFAGGIDGGRRVVAIAKMQGSFQITGRRNFASDQTDLIAVISGGHEPGTPYRIMGMAFRLICLNGAMFVQKALNNFTITHRHDLTTSALQSAALAFNRIQAEFGDYTSQQRLLAAAPVDSVHQNRLFVAELLAPGFARELVANTEATTIPALFERLGSDRDTAIQLNRALKANEDTPGFQRLGGRLLEAIRDQPGADESVYGLFNGVTHFVDHQRGRSTDVAVRESLFGSGAALKQRALRTALRLVGAEQEVDS